VRQAREPEIEGLRVAGRASQHLGPVVGQPFDVLWVARVGEGVGEQQVLETAPIDAFARARRAGGTSANPNIEGRPLREGSRIVIGATAWHVRRGARPRGFRAR
jgi:hypothetical protein